MQRRRILKALSATPIASALASIAAPTVARAADPYPSRPIHLIMGYAAGGTADISCRIIAPLLTERLGVPIVIENRASAGGIVASQAVLNAPADGYTLALAAPGNFCLTPLMFKSVPFDVVKDFEMVAQLATYGNVFAVSATSPYKRVSDIIAYAKANPGKLNVGTISVGSFQYFAAEMFYRLAGIQAVTVPYKSSGDVIAAVRSGAVHMIVESLAPVIAQMRSNELRPIGVTERERFPELPDVPPVYLTVPGYEVSLWNGLAARSGTPPVAIEKLNRALVEVLNLPDVKERYLKLGIVSRYTGPKQLRDRQIADIQQWGAVMNELHIEKQ
jgi:tripartite-type tricarboxylate transporter receptor subunit TctC